MTLWVVGRWITYAITSLRRWEICGVFSTEQKAIDVCQDETYFIGPVELDQQLPVETISWPNVYYPKTKEG
jgi:hypothetical protein